MSGHTIEITYCPRCGWLMRAAWMQQELLATFADDLTRAALAPDKIGGAFVIRVDDEVIWSRAEHGRFPEIAELKRLVRDRIAPGRDLGHIDRKKDG